MSTVYPGWKADLLALVNRKNMLSLKESDVKFESFIPAEHPEACQVTIKPGDNSPYFFEQSLTYVRRDIANAFTGIPLRFIVSTDVAFRNIIDSIAEKYGINFDLAVDFLEADLNKKISFETSGIQSVELPIAESSYVWSGHLQVQVINDTLDLITIIQAYQITGLRYLQETDPTKGSLVLATAAALDDLTVPSVDMSVGRQLPIEYFERMLSALVEAGKWYPFVVKRSGSSINELASRVVISTSCRQASHRMNNCEFNGCVMPAGWSDRGRYAYGMFWAYTAGERAIHSVMMSNKDDEVSTVFYIEGDAFPIYVYLEEGLSAVVPTADYVVGQTTYKWGATNPKTECVAADVILDFAAGRGFYSSHPVITTQDISGNKIYANDEVVVRSQTAIRAIGGEYGVLLRNDGSKTYLLLTDAGDQYGGWNALRPLMIDNATGEVTVGTKLLANGGVEGNISTATKLATARTIGGVSFDGSANIDLPGVNKAGTQNTSGNAATATKLQTARKIGGVAFDGTADIALPGVNAAGNQNTTGNAATATKLKTAVTIGGVSFDGSASINLPGVNATGNQSTSGNAGSATKLQTARTIGGVSFDGTANIDLPGVNATGNQNTTGNAASATKLQTARTIGGVSFNGTANINLPGVNTTGNQDTTGNAATATKLKTARTIGGVSFDGSANINLPGVNAAGNQNTSGNAATATKLQTARTISGVEFDGSKNITLTAKNVGATACPTGWLITGDNNSSITTSSFITLLQNQGAFNTRAWVARCSFAAADSAYIPDSETKCGIIPLAGAVIEVVSFGMTNYTIRVTTATTSSVSGAKTNSEFIYSYDNYNGSTNSPGWRRCYNSKNYSVNLSSYVTENQLTGYDNNLDIIANTLVVKNGSNGGFAVWDISTTTSGANMYISPVAGINNVFRSTSSRRYKKDIENITDEQADKVLEMRPVWYRSTCEADNKDWGWYGLIAEEVGEIAPQYVHWRDATEEDDPAIVSSNGLVAEGVMYERLVVPLIKQVQKLTAKVEALEEELKALKK